MEKKLKIGGAAPDAIRKTTTQIQKMVDDAWRDGYRRGTADCAADYETGLRKVHRRTPHTEEKEG